jgi:hypothetical protein
MQLQWNSPRFFIVAHHDLCMLQHRVVCTPLQEAVACNRMAIRVSDHLHTQVWTHVVLFIWTKKRVSKHSGAYRSGGVPRIRCTWVVNWWFKRVIYHAKWPNSGYNLLNDLIRNAAHAWYSLLGIFISVCYNSCWKDRPEDITYSCTLLCCTYPLHWVFVIKHYKDWLNVPTQRTQYNLTHHKVWWEARR